MAAKKAPKKERMGPPAPPPKKPSAGARAFGASTAIFVPPELQHEVGPTKRVPKKPESVVVKVPQRTESTSEKKARLARETHARERLRIGKHITSATGANRLDAVPDRIPRRSHVDLPFGLGGFSMYKPAHDIALGLGLAGKAAAIKGAKGIESWAEEVARAPMDMLTAAQSGGRSGPRTSLPIPQSVYKTGQVLGEAEPLARPIGSTAKYIGSEKGQEDIWGKSLVNLALHGDTPGSGMEAAGLSLGILGILPIGKLTQLARLGRAARAASKLEPLADSEARTAWRAVLSQRLGAEEADNAMILIDNIARNTAKKGEDPLKFYEKTKAYADNADDFLKTPGAKKALFQTGAGPRRGIVELAQGAARWTPNPNGEFIPGAGDMVQAGQHGVGLIDDIHGDTANIILESGKKITHSADDLVSVVPDPTTEVPVFYSPLQRKVALDIPEQGLTKAETIKTLAPPKSPGPTSTKLAEWEDSGMKDFVDGYAANEVIPKQDILAHLSTSLNAYNVDEVIRSSNSTAHGAKFGERTFGALTVRDSTEAEPYFELTMKLRTPMHQRVRKSVMGGGRREAAPYTGKGLSHWGESDVIAHVRFHVITDNEGKTALLVDEIQSDWASQYREFSRLGGKKGIEERLPKLERELEVVTQDAERIEHEGGNEVDLWELQDQMRELDAEQRHLTSLLKDVPGPAPLGKKQVEAAVRRTIRYANDAGVERIIIVRGDVQAIRNAAYEVTPKGRKVKLYDPLLDEETGSIEAQVWSEDTAGMTHEEVKAYANDPKHKESGPAKTFMRLYGDDTQKGDIPEIFEKEMGEKGSVKKGIFDGGYADQQTSIRRTSSADKVFEGKTYEINPDHGYGEMPQAGDMVGHEEGVGEFVKMAPNRKAVVRFADGERQVYLDDLDVMRLAEGAPQGVRPMDGFVIEMTPKAREKAAQPMSLYQKGMNPNDLPKGATEFFADGTQAMHLFETADVSTLIHELSHVALADINEVDRAVLGRHFDFSTVAGNEAYARAMERYIYEGMAMESELDGVFAKIKTWMEAVYQHVNRIGGHVHPEVKQVFDRMLVKPETPQQQLVRMLKEAPPVRRAQEAGYSEERGRRIEDMFEKWDREGGKDAFHTALASLKGELPKEEFTALDDLTPEALDSIVNAIRNSNRVRPYQKVRAAAAVVKATEGAVPTKSELELLERIFGKEVGFKKVRKNGIDQILVEIINIPRSLSASVDLSAPLRQGLVAGARHPIIFKRNFMPMVKALKVKNYEAQTESIVMRPNFERYQRAKLAVETHASDPAFANREEAFYSSYADKIPLVKHSSNAYSSFLHNMRADVFDHMIATAQAKNVKRAAKGKKLLDVDSAEFLEGLGMYVNTITGRGALPNTELLPIEKMAPGLNTLFFSPRLLASRINMISPFYYGKLWRKDPFIAKQAMRAMIHTVGGAVATLVIADQIPGVDVGLNPTSANFGKVRIGDTRIDMLAGFNPLMVFIARETLGYSTSSSSGKRQDLKGGFGQSTRKDILYRFGESKLAPSAGIARDILGGQTFIGQELTTDWHSVGLESLNFIPMMWRDAYEVGNESNDPTIGAAAAAAVVVLGGLGIGFSSYPDKAAKSSGGGSGGGGDSGSLLDQLPSGSGGSLLDNAPSGGGGSLLDQVPSSSGGGSLLGP